MLLCEWLRQTGNDLPPSIGRDGRDLPPGGSRCTPFKASDRVHRSSLSPKRDEPDLKLAATLAARRGLSSFRANSVRPRAPTAGSSDCNGETSAAQQR